MCWRSAAAGAGSRSIAAEELGCRVTAITVSREQFDHVRKLVADRGLTDRVEPRLEDFRSTRGAFDRIVSVEMIESIPQQLWAPYFAQLHDLTKPGGTIGLQVITVADRHWASSDANPDFVRRYVFPGGQVPSPTVLRGLARCPRSALGRGPRVRRLVRAHARGVGGCVRRARAARSPRWGSTSRSAGCGATTWRTARAASARAGWTWSRSSSSTQPELDLGRTPFRFRKDLDASIVRPSDGRGARMSSTDHLEVLQSIITEVIEPNAAGIDRDAKFPREALEAMGRAGLLGLVSAPEVGGSGGGIAEAAQVIRQIGGHCGSTAMVVTHALRRRAGDRGVRVHRASRAGRAWRCRRDARVLRGGLAAATSGRPCPRRPRRTAGSVWTRRSAG